MKEKELREQYQKLKEEYRRYEDYCKRLQILRQKMENSNPYKIIEKELEVILDTMENYTEDMNWYLDRINEVDNEKES